MPSGLLGGVSEQEKAGRHRLDDAQALLDAGRFRGSMYLADYAVERLLKTKLMKRHRCYNLRGLEDELRSRGVLASESTLFMHRLEVLFGLTGGMGRIKANASLWRHFLMVN